MKRETRDDLIRSIKSEGYTDFATLAVLALLADVVPEEERGALSTEDLAQRGFSKLPPHQRDSVVRNYGTVEPTPADYVTMMHTPIGGPSPARDRMIDDLRATREKREHEARQAPGVVDMVKLADAVERQTVAPTPAPDDVVERCARAAYEAMHPRENAFDIYNAEGVWTDCARAVLTAAGYPWPEKADEYTEDVEHQRDAANANLDAARSDLRDAIARAEKAERERDEAERDARDFAMRMPTPDSPEVIEGAARAYYEASGACSCASRIGWDSSDLSCCHAAGIAAARAYAPIPGGGVTEEEVQLALGDGYGGTDDDAMRAALEAFLARRGTLPATPAVDVAALTDSEIFIAYQNAWASEDGEPTGYSRCVRGCRAVLALRGTLSAAPEAEPTVTEAEEKAAWDALPRVHECFMPSVHDVRVALLAARRAKLGGGR